MAKHRPPFIDITSHAAQIVYEEGDRGFERRVKRKRPGTLGVCALIQNKYTSTPCRHCLCEGFTREETEDFLIELRYLGIDNVLAFEATTVATRSASIRTHAKPACDGPDWADLRDESW